MTGSRGSLAPFRITDKLINDLDSDLNVFRDKSEYANFPPRSKSPKGKKGGEIQFISKFVPDLDGASGEDKGSNLKIGISTKSFHKTPRVKFWWPGKTRFEGCELADLLLIVTYVDNNKVVGRRSVLSQTKYTYDDKYKTQRQWDHNPYQYYLLEELPIFYPVKPNLSEWYEIFPTNKSFSTYSFVSDFWLPFFHSTSGMASDYIPYSENRTRDYHYERTGNPPSSVQSLTGYLKMLIRGRYGESFDSTDRIGEFYQDIFSSSKAFDLSQTKNTLQSGSDIATDGGPNENRNNPRETEVGSEFGLVHVMVKKNSEEGILSSEQIPIDELNLKL